MKDWFNTGRRSGATRAARAPEVRPAERRERPRSEEDRIALTVRARTYAKHHLQVLLSSLGQLCRSPLSTLLTALVIGIALALPAGLYVLVKNVQTLSADWEAGAQISLFLKPDISDERAEQLAERLRLLPGIGGVNTLSRAAALEEFRQLSGFGDALNALDDNPLPAVLTINPSVNAARATETLADTLRALPEVEITQFDRHWLQRLHAILAVAQRGVLLLAGLLALAVLLIVGNTIRLAIHNRRDEIEITQLIGATDAFIRRPFLYSGLWYGLCGGLMAWLLVALSLRLLSGPVQTLATLYQSDFRLSGVDAQTVVILLGVGVALGILGSWLAVHRHLVAAEPV